LIGWRELQLAASASADVLSAASCGKSDPTGETACPTSLPLLDLLWWGRRFRLPFEAFAQFFRSL
jgi:hypothetical protein